MKSIKIALVMIMVFLSLTGCSGRSRDKALSIIDETMVYEQQFAALLSQIVELETKDQQTYQTVLDQGKEGLSNAKASIASGIIAIKERRDAMNQSRTLLQSSLSKLSTLEHGVNKLNSISSQEHQKELLNMYTTRSIVYEKLYNQYMNGLTQDEELYRLLANEAVNIKQISDLVIKRNGIFMDVSDLMKEFNQLSTDLHQTKLAFMNDLAEI